MKTRYIKWLLAMTGLLIFLPAAYGAAPAQPTAKSDRIVAVYAYGIVEARRHSTLSAKFPGKLEKILVQEGEKVEHGQLLALFEARELEARNKVAAAAVAVAAAALAEAEAGARPQEIKAADEQLAAAEAQLGKAKADWERYERLLAGQAVAASDWEQYRLRLDSAQANRNAAHQHLLLLQEGTRPETVAILKKRLQLARAEADLAAAVLDTARLTAPYDGVITRKHREEGEALDIGQPVMDIATLDDRYIRAEIDETDIGRVRMGQAVQVTADGFPGLTFAGKVVEIKQQMGPKKLIPTDPAKIIDYKVLDLEVSLPADCPFPIKLPVNVHISLQ